MRVKPSLVKGVLVLVGYLAVVFSVWIIVDLDYDAIPDSVETVRKGVTLAMACGAVYLVAVVSLLGWWKPAMREPRRAHHPWMWAIPALLALGVVGNLAVTKWDRIDDVGSYVLYLGIGCLLVGFNEEMVTRGQLIVGARGKLHEGWVWFVSSLCFGLLHVPNAFFGQGLGATMTQVFFAFSIGTAYYVCRRISGLLVVTMLLHGTWDFSTFIQSHSVDGMADKPIAVGAYGVYLAAILGFVAVWRLHRKDGDVIEPGADQLAAFEAAPAVAA